MVNIYQHTQYCEGRGYVNPRSFADAMTQEKTATRVARDGMEQLVRGQLQQTPNANPFATTSLSPRIPALLVPIATLTAQVLFAGRQALQTLMQPPLQLTQNAAQLAQSLQQNPNFLVRATGQILGFFFGGSKRARNERDEKADEMRERNDTTFADPLTFSSIKEPTGSHLNQGG